MKASSSKASKNPWWWMPWWPVSVKAEPTLRGLRVVKGHARAVGLAGRVMPWELVGQILNDSSPLVRLRIDEGTRDDLALIDPPERVSVKITGGRRAGKLAKRLRERRLDAIARGEPFVAFGQDVNRWEFLGGVLMMSSLSVLAFGVVINQLMSQGLPQPGPQPWWGWVTLAVAVLMYVVLFVSPIVMLVLSRPAKRGMKRVRLDELGLAITTSDGQTRAFSWDDLKRADVIKMRRLIELEFAENETVRFSTDLHVLTLCAVIADERLGTHLRTKGARTPAMARRMAWRMIAYGVTAALIADLAVVSLSSQGLMPPLAPGLRVLLYAYFIVLPGMIAGLLLWQARTQERTRRATRSA